MVGNFEHNNGCYKISIYHTDIHQSSSTYPYQDKWLEHNTQLKFHRTDSICSNCTIKVFAKLEIVKQEMF